MYGGIPFSFIQAQGAESYYSPDWSSATVQYIAYGGRHEKMAVSGMEGVYMAPLPWLGWMGRAARFLGGQVQEIDGYPLPWDGGFFYLDSPTDGLRVYSVFACPEGLPNTWSGGTPTRTTPDMQCEQVLPKMVFGDFNGSYHQDNPDVTYANNRGVEFDFARLMTGFISNEYEGTSGWEGGPFDTSYWNTVRGIGALGLWFPEILVPATGTVTLYHYQPWCWVDNPIRCIASVISRVGSNLSFDWLLMDIAERAYQISPWVDTDWRCFIHRRMGETVFDLVKSIVYHTGDLAFFTMQGKFGIGSRQWPLVMPALTNSGTARGGADGIVRWKYGLTSEFVHNTVEASYGSGFLVSGYPNPCSDIDSGATYNYGTQNLTSREITDLSESEGGKWTVTDEVATSVAIHGARKNKVTTLPLTLKLDGAVPHMTRWLSETAEALYHWEIEQDLRGLAYDNGWIIDDLDVTDEVPAAAKTVVCYEKTIDFQNLRVVSKLLQRSTISGDYGTAENEGSGEDPGVELEGA